MDDNTPPPSGSPDPTPADPTPTDFAGPSDVEGADARRRKWIIGGVVAVVALVLLIGGAIFVYTQFLSDSDPELTTDDLSELVAGTDAETTQPTSETTETTAAASAGEEPSSTGTDDDGATGTTGTTPAADETAATEPAGGEPTETDAGSSTSFDGTWTPTEDSVFGYRVEEVIAGVNVTATGRSNEIDGSLEVDGTTAAVDIAVEVENITSDDSRRDSAFRGRIMEADDFPQATFVSTEPIEFGAIPADGEQITATVTGDLTLKDVTNNVTFEVTAEATSDRIGVLGNIPILFEDYGIDNPSFGAIKTEDDGLLEFILVFEPA